MTDMSTPDGMIMNDGTIVQQCTDTILCVLICVTLVPNPLMEERVRIIFQTVHSPSQFVVEGRWNKNRLRAVGEYNSEGSAHIQKINDALSSKPSLSDVLLLNMWSSVS